MPLSADLKGVPVVDGPLERQSSRGDIYKACLQEAFHLPHSGGTLRLILSGALAERELPDNPERILADRCTQPWRSKAENSPLVLSLPACWSRGMTDLLPVSHSTHRTGWHWTFCGETTVVSQLHVGLTSLVQLRHLCFLC